MMTFLHETRISFWKWVMIWVFARVRVAVGPVERAPIGLPHMRDPDSPCRAFEPEQYYTVKELGVLRSRSFDCPGDGHYLCRRCLYFNQEEYERIGGE